MRLFFFHTSATTNGISWISPVFYGFDEEYNIYWVSDKNAKHSMLIRSNPHVAIVIFNSQAKEGEGDGVYIEADVSELTDLEEVKKGIRIRDARVTVSTYRVKHLEDVTNEGVWRVYKATPKHILKLTEGAFIKGQYVDQRIEVTLK